MYSANGTGCCLTYRATRPRPGRYRRLALDTLGSGSSRTAPRMRGASLASTVALMTAAASGLRSGSMSEAFSGHTTRSGLGWVPAFTAAATRWVTAAWLSSTARRSALNLSPARGTLPCTARNRPVAPVVDLGTARGASMTARAPRTQGTADRALRAMALLPGPDWAADRRPPTTWATPAANRAPTSATPKVTAGAPPRAASPARGESAWLNARRPQGNPPNGVVSRRASCATQADATTSGRTLPAPPRDGPRWSRAQARPSSAMYRDSSTARAIHGSAPT